MCAYLVHSYIKFNIIYISYNHCCYKVITRLLLWQLDCNNLLFPVIIKLLLWV